MDLSIIITSWNTRELLADLLRSLEKHRPRTPHEIIVVDNASVDGSAAMVQGDFPGVRLLQNGRNLGFARANNQGAGVATGGVLLLLGSDTLVIDDSIDRMHDYLCARPGTGAVSCRLLNPDGTPQLSVRRFPRFRDAVLTYLSLHRWTRHYTMQGFDHYATQEVDQPAATCLMVRREAIPGALFDERYSILYNDVELCLRLRQAGWTIEFLGTAEVIHHGSRSTTQSGPALRLEMYRNILLYYREHSGTGPAALLAVILAVRLSMATRSLAGLRLLFPHARGSTL